MMRGDGWQVARHSGFDAGHRQQLARTEVHMDTCAVAAAASGCSVEHKAQPALLLCKGHGRGGLNPLTDATRVYRTPLNHRPLV
jgi:hypothetical protein